jgi:hypothetical protein
MFGNTARVAEAVARGLERGGYDVSLVDVALAPTGPRETDVVVVGAPTHGFSLSRPNTREDAVRRGADPAHAGTGVREWIDTLPRDAVFPPGRSADEVKQAETQMMETSQDDAVVAALRAAGQPVEQRPAVASITVGGPAYGKLLPGDLIESVDGVDTPVAEDVSEQIRNHRPNERVDFVVLRDRVETARGQLSVRSSADGTTVEAVLPCG